MTDRDQNLDLSHNSPNNHRSLAPTASLPVDHPNGQLLSPSILNTDILAKNSPQLHRVIRNEGLSAPPSPTPSLNINRQIFNVREFNENYIPDEREKTIKEKFGKYKPDFSKKAWIGRMTTCFPITAWLPAYNIRQNLLADIIVGITIASFQVPQSMGYALIAQVNPIYGLYAGFFPALFYTIFGTSFHSSVGPVAIVAGLMTGNIVKEVSDELNRWYDETRTPANGTGDVLAGFEDITNIDIVTMVAIINGIYLLFFGILRLGFISNYLSEEMVSGFMTSAALHVFTTQVHYLTGVHLKNHSGIFALPNTYIEFFSKITSVNLTALIISLICIAILLFFKFCVEKLFNRMGLKIPFPIHLFIVIGGCVASYLMGLGEDNKVQVVGLIPNKFAIPSPPKFKLFRYLWFRCIPTSVVMYTQTLSIGRLYGNKHNYKVDPNQEMVAIGIANICGSFFKSLPCSASIPRSAVQEQGGGKTQIVSLVNCICILIVILVLSSLLQDLPNCVLAACISVALVSIISKFQDFLNYWSISKLDGSIWLITFLGVIFMNVDYGIYIGFGCSLLLLIYKSQRPKTYSLGSVDNSDIYVPLSKFKRARELRAVKIYQFCGPLNFANVEYFKNELQSRSGVDVRSIKSEMSELNPNQNCFIFGDSKNEKSKQIVLENKKNLPKYVIIDCSMLSYIDTTGVTTLKKLVQSHGEISIEVLLTGCPVHIETMLKKDGFFKEVSSDRVLKSVHDAVTYIREADPSIGWPLVLKNELNHNLPKIVSKISLESTLSVQTLNDFNDMQNSSPMIIRQKTQRSVTFSYP